MMKRDAMIDDNSEPLPWETEEFLKEHPEVVPGGIENETAFPNFKYKSKKHSIPEIQEMLLRRAKEEREKTRETKEIIDLFT